jgi:hypothetical protein
MMIGEFSSNAAGVRVVSEIYFRIIRAFVIDLDDRISGVSASLIQFKKSGHHHFSLGKLMVRIHFSEGKC